MTRRLAERVSLVVALALAALLAHSTTSSSTPQTTYKQTLISITNSTADSLIANVRALFACFSDSCTSMCADVGVPNGVCIGFVCFCTSNETSLGSPVSVAHKPHALTESQLRAMSNSNRVWKVIIYLLGSAGMFVLSLATLLLYHGYVGTHEEGGSSTTNGMSTAKYF